jgi:antitoxin component of MazEF toxin-antitoxin module
MQNQNEKNKHSRYYSKHLNLKPKEEVTISVENRKIVIEPVKKK